MIDRTLSHFKINAKIGEGGMGVVWKAEDSRLDRCLGKDPEDRWHSALDLAAELKWLSGSDQAKLPHAAPQALPSTAPELSGLLTAFMEFDLAAVYPEIEVPTLVAHHPEYFFPDTYSRRIASMIRDCRMAIFSGAVGGFITDLSIARAFLRGE